MRTNRVYRFKKTKGIAVLKKQTDTLHHRGSDGKRQEIYETENVQEGYGHRRLSIMDFTEGGSQPIVFNYLKIIFNGEIYNFNEVKEELIKLGHSFSSYSDTEMILHAFQKWGVKCIDKFIGMFAFVLYYEVKEGVYCEKGRARVKPIFYYRRDGIFIFSSELKALVAHPNF